MIIAGLLRTRRANSGGDTSTTRAARPSNLEMVHGTTQKQKKRIRLIGVIARNLSV